MVTAATFFFYSAQIQIFFMKKKKIQADYTRVYIKYLAIGTFLTFNIWDLDYIACYICTYNKF